MPYLEAELPGMGMGLWLFIGLDITLFAVKEF